MKTSLLVVLLAVTLALNGLLWHRVSNLERWAGEEYPLGQHMGVLQRYADKMWFAAEAGDWELAKFYQHELHETAEAVIDARVVDDGHAVSKIMAAMMPDALHSVKDAIKAKDAKLFRSRYTGLVATCNACHGATDHAFIRVAVPTGPSTFWNQDFGPTATN